MAVDSKIKQIIQTRPVGEQALLNSHSIRASRRHLQGPKGIQVTGEMLYFPLNGRLLYIHMTAQRQSGYKAAVFFKRQYVILVTHDKKNNDVQQQLHEECLIQIICLIPKVFLYES